MLIKELWHYPIKGLGGSLIDLAVLETGGYFPNDRQFAISTGHAKTANAVAGTWQKKAFFLQLMTDETLADYSCQFIPDGAVKGLHVTHRDGSVNHFDPSKPEDCTRLEDFFAARLEARFSGHPRLMQMDQQAYSDQSSPLISIASDASLNTFAKATGTIADNRRFRINVIISADQPFAEADLIGKTVRCGTALLAIKAPVGRCAAINVNPDTAQRGPDYVAFMRAHFGHSNLGVFAEIIDGGTIKSGDQLIVT